MREKWKHTRWQKKHLLIKSDISAVSRSEAQLRLNVSVASSAAALHCLQTMHMLIYFKDAGMKWRPKNPLCCHASFEDDALICEIKIWRAAQIQTEVSPARSILTSCRWHKVMQHNTPPPVSADTWHAANFGTSTFTSSLLLNPLHKLMRKLLF